MILELTKISGEIDYASTQECMDAARDRAIAEGLTVVLGEPHVLLLDLDDAAEINEAVLIKLIEVTSETPVGETWTSRGGRGHHMQLTFQFWTFTPAEAMALECALGSDPLRTLFGVSRLKNGVKQPRMLFRPKEQS